MRPPFVILDFPGSASRPGGGSLLFENPLHVLSAAAPSGVAPLLRRIDAEVALGKHAVGFVSYEAAPAFDPAFAVNQAGALPLAWFGIFDAPRAFTATPGVAAPATRWRERADARQFARAVEYIHGAIGRGDVYQVNYTIRLDVDLDADIAHDTAALYQRLLAAQGPGYGARIHTGRHEVLSASPELFFERRGDHITTRPMKGTARRGRWLDEDNRRADALASTEKERAENVMIVDLLRNDLGRVSRTGSVRVPQLFHVERRPTVLQMTSTVEATLRAGVTTRELFTALFPCGSVTGAPKIAATSTIAALEDSPRGVYCGAIGHVAPGESTFSVAIRTLTFDHETGRAEYGVGSGITWDSAPAAEYDEVVAKAGILTHDLPRFELLETLRLEHGAYARLERHLARLHDSAVYFGWDGDAVCRAARNALRDEARAKRQEARVRLTVTPDAVATIAVAPLPERGPSAHVVLASSPVKRVNRFLYHKTTHRAVYDRHRAEHPQAFDVLLYNEDGELTEFTIGNFVAEIDGARWTPPRECGLLAGVFREELLDRRAIRERVIRRDELARVTRMWLVNSLRGWLAVRFEKTR